MKRERELAAEERQQKLLDYIFRAALVASNGYQERRLFPDHFEQEAGLLPSGDADTDFDYGEVEWRTPDEAELAMIQQMLADPTITVAAGADEEHQEELPPPRQVPLAEIQQDREWV